MVAYIYVYAKEKELQLNVKRLHLIFFGKFLHFL